MEFMVSMETNINRNMAKILSFAFFHFKKSHWLVYHLQLEVSFYIVFTSLHVANYDCKIIDPLEETDFSENKA